MERTLILLKPCTVQRRLIGEIINRIERKGLRIVGMAEHPLPRDRIRRFHSFGEEVTDYRKKNVEIISNHSSNV